MRMATTAAVISSLAAASTGVRARVVAAGIGSVGPPSRHSCSLIRTGDSTGRAKTAASFATPRYCNHHRSSPLPRSPTVTVQGPNNSNIVAVGGFVSPSPAFARPPRSSVAVRRSIVNVMSSNNKDPPPSPPSSSSSSRPASSSPTQAGREDEQKRPSKRPRRGGGSEDEGGAPSADEERGEETAASVPTTTVPLYRSEGLFAVIKPLEWTSQDVVSFVRKMLERDARDRGAAVAKLGRRRRGKNKNRGTIKVGHGGTLDPLATGVLVLGVGRGTKELQKYLSGNKRYTADVTLGYETTTLDSEGDVTREAPHDHVTLDALRDAVRNNFTGRIMQVPPVYSAIQRDGKRLYEEARKGRTAEELGVEAREVHVHEIGVVPKDSDGPRGGLPSFGLEVECGGGTYVRSLVRDIGQSVGSAATMTGLVRTRQGPFLLEHCLERDEWNPESIAGAIHEWNRRFEADTEVEVATDSK